jgi:diacylglycerol kinase
MFRFSQFLRSFRYALRGLYIVWREEQSFRVQIFAALLIFILALLLKVKNYELLVLVMISTFVLVLEVLNSILERIVDALRPRINIFVEAIKDMMAAAVLLASVSSVIIGILIFWPYIKNLFS